MKTISQLPSRRPDFRRGGSRNPWLHTLVLAVSFHSLIAAQGPVSAVQDALKREKYYAGESNGMMDEPTRNALRWYQTKHGLPVTGEIDSDTLQALENSKDAGKPTLQSVPHQAPEAGPTVAAVEADRAFLQKAEQVESERAAVEPPPAPVAAAAPPPAANPPPPAAALPPPILPAGTPSHASTNTEFVPPPASPAPTTPAPGSSEQRFARSEETVPVETKKRPFERVRPAHQPEGGFRPHANSAPVERSLEPIASAPPQRRPDLRGSTMRPRSFEEDMPVGILDDPGIRITRSTATGPDGRTIIYERRTTFGHRPPPAEVRRAVPVQPRQKRITFFDRIFNGDEDDD